MLSALVLAVLAQEPSDAELAVGRLQPAPGLRAALFAAEPDVVNPIGIALDGKGRVYLAETRRYNTAALYVLQHGHTYFDDLACRSVDDRVALARKWFGSELDRFEKASEVVRRLEDADGDGRADRSVVLAESFRGILDGCASGVLARGDDVWVTSVPSLWRVRNGKTEALARGFGVRFGNSGHDLHGPCFGPDGRIYFTMGDRGFAVGPHAYPDEGAVLRCDPDGANLEVFARGLRNPQGLCFDDKGNLWTCDNNADMGDGARWLWLVEGGDYGWRVGYQYATDPWGAQELPKGYRMPAFRDGPWMSENLWQGGAAYVLPPSGHVTAGPTGMDFYPGTGLPERYRGRFVVGDFAFGLYSCAVKPKGAGFELVDVDRFLWGCWPTDAKFGPDGALYVADWVHGFPMTGKGRVFRVFDPAAPPSDTKSLLAAGTDAVSDAELLRRLAHPDLRVRQAAQFALASRTATNEAASFDAAARLHWVFALGQRKDGARLLPFLGDADVDVRAQAARLVGELRPGGAATALRPLLADPVLRVRFHALRAYARAAGRSALPEVVAFLKDPSNDDPWLRHAAVLALLESADVAALVAAAAGAPRSVRQAVIVALRRLESPELRRFLSDPDPDLVLEAAQAINDVPIPPAMDDLASLASGPPRALLRAVNARFRRGTPADAAALADLALREDAPADVRAEAALALGSWGRPSGRDRVCGAWRPLPERDAAPAREALGRSLAGLLRGPERVRVHALRSAARLHLEAGPALAEAAFRDPAQPSAVRVESLQLLTAKSLLDAAADADVDVRREGIRLAAKLPAADAAAVLLKAAEDGPIAVRQEAIRSLGAVGGADAERGVGAQLDRLLEGRLEPALHLEVLEASARKPGLRERLARYEASRNSDDPLAAWRETLEGGDAKSGRRNFFDNASLGCLRCHTIGATGGQVGPPLTTVAAQKSREQLLEALLYPNREIAKGYGQELVQTTSGAIETGRILSESAAELVLVAADGREIRLSKEKIRARKPGLSAMPDDLGKKLSKRELRDLVAFLAGLR
jgi:quinoprotein glucose dehydrogenase